MVSPAPISSTTESAGFANDSCARRTATEATDTGLAPTARIGTRALGGDEGVLEQAVEPVAQGACRARCRPSVLDLAEDLRFAEHQRIQPGRDAEQMAYGPVVLVAIQISTQVAHTIGMRGEPFAERKSSVVGDRIQFGAVAGRQQSYLAHLRQRAQGSERGGQGFVGKGHPFAQGDRRGLVVDAEGDEVGQRAVITCSGFRKFRMRRHGRGHRFRRLR